MDTNTQVKEAEVVNDIALARLDKDNMLSMVKDQDRAMFMAMSSAESLDWRSLAPNVMALILTAKPFKVSGGGVTYLTYKQGLLFSLRAYELGVSPLSSEIWFNLDTGQASLTLEGQKKVARNMGMDLGPPQFSEISRDWDALPKSSTVVEDLKRAGFSKDAGIKCRIRVGKPEHNEFCEYTAYLSEWYVSRSPIWQAKPMHMLQTRAYSRCLSLTMGTGASDMVD